MSVLENAIRNALARSDRTDADIRARVYNSARAALDNGLLKQGIVDEAVVAAQRQRLENLIDTIEAEEQEAVLAQEEAAVPSVSASRRLSDPPVDQQAPDVMAVRRDEDEWSAVPEPVTRRDRIETQEPEPVVPERTEIQSVGQNKKNRKNKKASAPVVDGEKRVRRSRARSSWFTRIFILGLLAAFAFGAFVWAEQSGLIGMVQNYRATLANQDVAEDSDSTPLIKNPLDPRHSFDSEWLEVFKGQDSSAIITKGDATVESDKAAEGDFARITSVSAGKSGEVVVSFPAALVSQLAGKTSTIALTLASGSDESTQMSVQCDFGALGDCGRHRFNVTTERSDFLFQVKNGGTSDGAADGKIIINSDVSGQGKSVKLFAIRILPGQ